MKVLKMITTLAPEPKIIDIYLRGAPPFNYNLQYMVDGFQLGQHVRFNQNFSGEYFHGVGIICDIATSRDSNYCSVWLLHPSGVGGGGGVGGSWNVKRRHLLPA